MVGGVKSASLAGARGRLMLAAATVSLILIVGLCSYMVRAGASNAADSSKYYVSIGDSYAAGYRPDGAGSGSTSRDGFAYQLMSALNADRNDWKLANFGCSGETAYAMAFEVGCAPAALAPDGIQYRDDPQAIAAVEFIAEHRDNIGLVTIAMGGNDLLRCLGKPDSRAGQACAEESVPKVVGSLDALLAKLRGEVGHEVPIVGISYINVFLADAMSDDPVVQERANWSRVLFENYLNPALRQMYSKYNATFIDTTALAGGYMPATEKTSTPELGTVTASIGRVCALTYYCSDRDVHPDRAGHALIASAVENAIGS
jgi:lysophospholipase L1-like esterase